MEVVFARSDRLCSRDVRKLRNGLGPRFTPGFYENVSASVWRILDGFWIIKPNL